MTAVPAGVNYRLLREIRVAVVRYPSHVFEGPVGDDRLADDVVDGNGAEDPRVGAVPAVVAEDEDVAFRHDNRWTRIGFAVGRTAVSDAGADVWLVELDAIDVDVAVVDLDRLAGGADDPLDIWLVVSVWRVEDDDIAALGADRTGR